MKDTICPSCDSTDVAPFPGVDDLYECLACGDVFEADTFYIKKIQRRREISVKKEHE